MKTAATILILFGLLCTIVLVGTFKLADSDRKSKQVFWISDKDPKYQGKSFELGFRKDGVVVWREIKTPTEAKTLVQPK